MTFTDPATQEGTVKLEKAQKYKELNKQCKKEQPVAGEQTENKESHEKVCKGEVPERYSVPEALLRGYPMPIRNKKKIAPVAKGKGKGKGKGLKGPTEPVEEDSNQEEGLQHFAYYDGRKLPIGYPPTAWHSGNEWSNDWSNDIYGTFGRSAPKGKGKGKGKSHFGKGKGKPSPGGKGGGKHGRNNGYGGVKKNIDFDAHTAEDPSQFADPDMYSHQRKGNHSGKGDSRKGKGKGKGPSKKKRLFRSRFGFAFKELQDVSDQLDSVFMKYRDESTEGESEEAMRQRFRDKVEPVCDKLICRIDNVQDRYVDHCKSIGCGGGDRNRSVARSVARAPRVDYSEYPPYDTDLSEPGKIEYVDANAAATGSLRMDEHRLPQAPLKDNGDRSVADLPEGQGCDISDEPEKEIADSSAEDDAMHDTESAWEDLTQNEELNQGCSQYTADNLPEAEADDPVGNGMGNCQLGTVC